MAAERQGSRWLHEPPSEEQIREWFAKQKIHPGLDHEDYIGGVVIIGATEKYKVTKPKANGDTYTVENERAVFTPYVKVDTRIAYFWDLVREMGDEYIGVIEPVPVRRIDQPNSLYFNLHLPEGFFMFPARNADDSVQRFIGCTWRVAIYERQSYGRSLRGEKMLPVLAGQGTKQTTLNRKFADDNALMKAETSAIGRALGVAGILVVGTGVASAEDIQEDQTSETGPATSTTDTATLPSTPDADQLPTQSELDELPEGDDDLRTFVTKLAQDFRQQYPEAFAVYQEWYNGRKFGAFTEIEGPALKGAALKLQRDYDKAKQVAVASDG